MQRLACLLLLAALSSFEVGAALRFSSRKQQAAGSEDNARSVARALLASTAQAACAPSWLGYQCTQLVCGRVRVHWSLGGEAPSKGCSYGTSSSSGVPDVDSAVVHMAVQTDKVTGWLGAAFPKRPRHMEPADSIMAWSSPESAGQPNPIGAYYILGTRPEQVVLDNTVQLSHTALEINATTFTMCFTRDLMQVGRAKVDLTSTKTAVDMNFAVSSYDTKRVHSMEPDYLCSAVINLQAQPDASMPDNGWRPSDVGASGSAEREEAGRRERLGYMRDHGALMFTGWIALVPLGILAARHKWLFARREGLWFQVHRAVQVAASVLIISGFILPYTSWKAEEEEESGGSGSETESDLIEIHGTLGIIAISLLSAHLVLTVIRPKPDAPRRWIWNYAHWWAGRGVALAAGVNVCLGIALWRRASGGSGTEWVVPLVVLAVCYVLLHFYLARRGKEAYLTPDQALNVGVQSSSELAQMDAPYGRIK